MTAFLRAVSWSHVGVAAAVFIVLALCGWPLIGAVIPVAFYWGRELRDAENVTGTPPSQGWRLALPISWPMGQQADFWPVAAACAALYAGWHLICAV